MRRAFLLLLSLVIGLGATTPAWAQLSKPRRDPFVKTYPPTVDRAPARPRVPLTSLVPPPRLALTGLPPVGDGGPACRSQCTRERYTCSAVGADDACGSRWATCLAVCSPSSRPPRPR